MTHNQPLLKAQSPAALAEEYLIKSIWGNLFPAGSDLPSERDLAEKIGVTRTTLREVLQRLARDGWLTIQHGRPTKVNNIWETAGPHIIETLITLDQASAPLIISNMLSLRARMSEAYIAEAIIRNRQQALALFDGLESLADTAEAYTQFDYHLFRQFTFAADKPFYGLIFNSFKGVYCKIGCLFFRSAERRAITSAFYRALQQCCQDGQPDTAVELIRRHNQRSAVYWKDILATLPADFSD